jgi:iron complex outermembrane receptor protein
LVVFTAVLSSAQEYGSVSGTVTLKETGEPLHGAVVLIVGLGEFTSTDEKGNFRIDNVPAGKYELLVQREHLTAERQEIEVVAEQNVEASFVLELSPVHETVTVTTSARGQSTTLESFNSVTSLDSFELAKDMSGTMGEVLENEPGIAKRSYGPGPTRPIIRGFDGDRVLIMEDGMRTADLSSQSGDHGTTVDPANVERIEVVRGPATLLYGSNAVGGVVNAITPQDSFRRSRPEGMWGQTVFDAGTANEQAGVNANLRYGTGNWMYWGGGGTRRSGDYDTPEGTVLNSGTNLSNGNAGFGFYGDRAYGTFAYGIEHARYGIPGAGAIEGNPDLEIDVAPHRQYGRFDFGLHDLTARVVDGARVTLQYVDYTHDEIETISGEEEIGTSFKNGIFLLRAELDQRKKGGLTGKFGIWGQFRDYSASGEEVLAPPTTQNAFAGFVYEELELAPSTTLQFGGRVESNDYNPEPREEEEGAEEAEVTPPEVIPRNFTGFSGSVGIRQQLASSAAFVASVSRSYRAPALEELYNFGPHAGNLAFEIGNTNLDRESILGVDLSLKGGGRKVDGDFNFYYYDIDNFVFLDVTDEIVDGLRVAPYLQGDSRFVGFDGEGNFRLHENLWLKLGLGYVSARLTDTDEPLPRIPPFHGRFEIELPFKALTVAPELIWATQQDEVFFGETTTDGYAVFNLKASYVLARTHAAHIFSVNAYNLTNELYRMHTSFIKDLAPEMGRGIKFTYSLRFF